MRFSLLTNQNRASPIGDFVKKKQTLFSRQTMKMFASPLRESSFKSNGLLVRCLRITFAATSRSDQRHTRQQHRKLSRVDPQSAAIVCRIQLFERTGFEQSIIQPVTPAIEMQQFHPVATAVDKDEQTAISRIGLKLAPHDSTESVESLSHVGRAGVCIDREVTGKIQHDESPAAVMLASSSCLITVSTTRRSPPISTSMPWPNRTVMPGLLGRTCIAGSVISTV